MTQNKGHPRAKSREFSETRFGPNRPAADMEGNGMNFGRFMKKFGGTIEYFWRN